MLKKHFVFRKISLKINVLPLAISGIVSWLILTFSVEEVPTIVGGRGHLFGMANIPLSQCVYVHAIKYPVEVYIQKNIISLDLVHPAICIIPYIQILTLDSPIANHDTKVPTFGYNLNIGKTHQATGTASTGYSTADGRNGRW